MKRLSNTEKEIAHLLTQLTSWPDLIGFKYTTHTQIRLLPTSKHPASCFNRQYMLQNPLMWQN